MSFQVSDCISRNQQRTNTVGQRLSNSDFHLFLNDAIKYFYTNYKIPTAQRETDLVAYPGVLEYPLPSDFIGLIEPKRPYGLESPNFNHTTEREFVHWPYGRTTSIKFNGANSYLILQETSGSTVSVDTCDSVAGWTVAGDASNLYVDNQIYTSGTGSLAFTVTPTGSFSLSKTLDQALDITDYKTKAKLFLDIQCPGTALTSLTARLGNNVSNYWTMTATTRHRGDTLASGCGLVSFDLASAVATGSPSLTNANYIYIEANDATASAGTYRIDNIFISQGTYYQIPYYSKYLVQDSVSTWKEKITDDSDFVICPSDCDEAIEFKMLEIAGAIRLKDAGFAKYFAKELKPKEQYIKAKYPRMESRNQTTYYKNSNF